MLLPYIDIALRQIEHLPHQAHVRIDEASPHDSALSPEHNLTEREIEIMRWTEMGKTNPEIGSILSISAFTVKNHLQRIFRKLNVSNRAQAVGEFLRIFNHESN
jgi:DNA-binding CsgD family transcriptional regulator